MLPTFLIIIFSVFVAMLELVPTLELCLFPHATGGTTKHVTRSKRLEELKNHELGALNLTGYTVK
jgi:hypothetical protein